MVETSLGVYVVTKCGCIYCVEGCIYWILEVCDDGGRIRLMSKFITRIDHSGE